MIFMLLRKAGGRKAVTSNSGTSAAMRTAWPEASKDRIGPTPLVPLRQADHNECLANPFSQESCDLITKRNVGRPAGGWRTFRVRSRSVTRAAVPGRRVSPVACDFGGTLASSATTHARRAYASTLALASLFAGRI